MIDVSVRGFCPSRVGNFTIATARICPAPSGLLRQFGGIALISQACACAPTWALESRPFGAKKRLRPNPTAFAILEFELWTLAIK
jgi:hypothetical protein